MNLQVYHLTTPHPITLWITSNQNSFYWVFITFSILNHLVQIFHSEPVSHFFEAFQCYVSVHVCIFRNHRQTSKCTWKPKKNILKKIMLNINFLRLVTTKKDFQFGIVVLFNIYKSTLITMLWCSLKGGMWVWFILLFFSFPTKITIWLSYTNWNLSLKLEMLCSRCFANIY